MISLNETPYGEWDESDKQAHVDEILSVFHLLNLLLSSTVADGGGSASYIELNSLSDDESDRDITPEEFDSLAPVVERVARYMEIDVLIEYEDGKVKVHLGFIPEVLDK